jgi:hypothetical protein
MHTYIHTMYGRADEYRQALEDFDKQGLDYYLEGRDEAGRDEDDTESAGAGMYAYACLCVCMREKQMKRTHPALVQV